MQPLTCVNCGAPLKRGRRSCEYCETEYLGVSNLSFIEDTPDYTYKGWVFANATYGIPQCGGGGGGGAGTTTIIKY